LRELCDSSEYIRRAFTLEGHERSTYAHCVSPPIDSYLLTRLYKVFGTSLTFGWPYATSVAMAPDGGPALELRRERETLA
jgi:hypothetical protein